ncbi:hypothetical protein N7510_006627 [Penicillium lagena]|uniref:uncharacterized protein n=1 Tax=Penicillium lagena TaxID=94218 RepID=UPI0025402AB4|nr:uncharacterized protein N7510_006627 [Penicillium lagena]KAJ5613433.1 hypothetical protein N7510_006627 [Penicillium lagena]
MRAELRGLLVREGMPCLTKLSTNVVSTIRYAVATSDPMAIARFFHYTYKAVFDSLLSSKTADIRILRDVSNYFGVVESNRRGMLHLHILVWVRGNLSLIQLRDYILVDGDFANRIISFLEAIVMHSLHGSNEDLGSTISNTPPLSTGLETDSEFIQNLSYNSNRVTHTKQLHSKRHIATYFKYYSQRSNNNVYRFGMPYTLLDASKADEHSIIHLTRNHA